MFNSLYKLLMGYSIRLANRVREPARLISLSCIHDKEITRSCVDPVRAWSTMIAVQSPHVCTSARLHVCLFLIFSTITSPWALHATITHLSLSGHAFKSAYNQTSNGFVTGWLQFAPSGFGHAGCILVELLRYKTHMPRAECGAEIFGRKKKTPSPRA